MQTNLKIKNKITGQIIFDGLVTDIELNQYTDHIDVEFKTLNVEYDLRLDNSMMIVIGELYGLDN